MNNAVSLQALIDAASQLFNQLGPVMIPIIGITLTIVIITTAFQRAAASIYSDTISASKKAEILADLISSGDLRVESKRKNDEILPVGKRKNDEIDDLEQYIEEKPKRGRARLTNSEGEIMFHEEGE